MAHLNDKKAYIIVTDGEFDQVCETMEQALQEKFDHHDAFDFEFVDIVVVAWDEQDRVIERIENDGIYW